MKTIETHGYTAKTSQWFNSRSGNTERRYYGALGLKIFVPMTDKEEADREQATSILTEALNVLNSSGGNWDASWEDLREVKQDYEF